MTPSPPILLAVRADLGRARGGDVLAFGRIVEATQSMVTALALAVVRDRRASERVAFDIYAEAWRELERTGDTDGFLVALRQRARSFAAASVRARSHSEGSAAGSLLLRAVEEEESRIVGRAFDSVPEPLREALAVHYREGAANARVAALLGLSEDRVALLLDQARGLRSDVLATFEQIARRTSPGRDLTGRIVHRIREETARAAKPRPPVARRVAMALGLRG